MCLIQKPPVDSRTPTSFSLIRSRPPHVVTQELRARKMCKRTVKLGIGLPLVLPLLVHGFVDQTHVCVARPAVPSTRTTPEGALAPAVRSAYHDIIGESSQMAEIFTRIDKVAVGDVNVCIHGESGTGKELIARAIHYASPRRDRPLITLDCTTD